MQNQTNSNTTTLLQRIHFLTRCKQRILFNPPKGLLSALYSWQRIKGEAYRGHGGNEKKTITLPSYDIVLMLYFN